jgi:phage shock protein E
MITSRRSLAFSLVLGACALVACNGARAAQAPVTVEASVLRGQLAANTAPLIVDVRTADEYAAGHVPGAINIPYDQMEERVDEIIAHKDQDIVLYCRSGRRSGIAAKTLEAKGFTKLGLLEGDMPGWERAGYPVER